MDVPTCLFSEVFREGIPGGEKKTNLILLLQRALHSLPPRAPLEGGGGSKSNQTLHARFVGEDPDKSGVHSFGVVPKSL